MCDSKTDRMFVEKSIFYKHLTSFGVKQNDEKPNIHFIYDKSERENITDKELQAVLKDNGII